MFIWHIIGSIITSIALYFIGFPLLFLLYGGWWLFTFQFLNKSPKGMELIEPRDALFLQDGTIGHLVSSLSECNSNPCNIHAIFQFESSFPVELLQELYVTRVLHAANKDGSLQFDRFKKRVAIFNGEPYWTADETFNIANHIKNAPEQYANQVKTFEDLINLVGDTYSEYLYADGLPLWFVWAFNIDGKTVVYYRIHHSYGDGMSLVPGLLNWMEFVDSGNPKKERTAPSTFSHFNTLFQVLHTLFSGALDQLTLLLSSPDSSLLHGPKLSGIRRCCISRDYDVDDIKAIRKALGGTFNDVIMYLVSTTIRKFLLLKQPDKPVPKEIRLIVPMNTRKFNAPLYLNNQFAPTPIPLPLNENWKDRFANVRKFMQDAKIGISGLAVQFAISVSTNLLPNSLTRFLFDRMASRCTAVFSNVSGPKMQLAPGGNILDYMAFFVPARSNCGVGFSLFSLNNKIKIAFSIDEALSTDVISMRNCFEEGLEEILRNIDCE